MRSARVVCVCSLTAEVFTLADGPDKRLAEEAEALATQKSYTEVLARRGASGTIRGLASLLPSGLGAIAAGVAGVALDKFVDRPGGRPTISIVDFIPKEWSVNYNTFRKADELEITIPLSMLPVPPHAIRGARIQAVIRNISDDDWAAGIRPSSNTDEPDFFGTLKRSDITIGEDEIGTVKLPFLDLVGVLSTTKVPPGKILDEEAPLTQSIAQFLVGTWGEGLPVRWVDPRDPEPSLGKYRPALFKANRGKKAQRETPSQYSYLDAITLACNEVGCVARVLGAEIQVAFAGAMYQGLDRRRSAPEVTLLVGQMIEEISAGHEYLGQKLQSVQVVAFDPATHKQYTARFPVDQDNKAAQTVEPNARATVPPIVASLGQPGSQALEDSIVQIPIGPVSNPDLLPQVAEAIFHERARQRTTFTIKTHSPWSNPFDRTSEADILTLRAGDNVNFGYVDNPLIPGAVKGLCGQLSQGQTMALLQSQGVSKSQAANVAAAVALVAPVDKLRVDEVKISGVDTDAAIELKLVTFTTIISDLQASADGRPLDTIVKSIDDAAKAVDAGISALRGFITRAREQIQQSQLSPEQQEAAQKELDRREQELLKGQ